MPRFDATGPRGLGPGTGRGMGPCGRGLAFRRGFGRGFGRFGIRFFDMGRVELTSAEQKKILEEELNEIELEKKEIEKKLKELGR